MSDRRARQRCSYFSGGTPSVVDGKGHACVNLTGIVGLRSLLPGETDCWRRKVECRSSPGGVGRVSSVGFQSRPVTLRPPAFQIDHTSRLFIRYSLDDTTRKFGSKCGRIRFTYDKEISRIYLSTPKPHSSSLAYVTSTTKVSTSTRLPAAGGKGEDARGRRRLPPDFPSTVLIKNQEGPSSTHPAFASFFRLPLSTLHPPSTHRTHDVCTGRGSQTTSRVCCHRYRTNPIMGGASSEACDGCR